MDPNTNQPLETASPINPVMQPQTQPQAQPLDQPTPTGINMSPNPNPTPTPTSLPQNPVKKSNKTIILLIILLLLSIGMVAYILFAKNQLNNTQKATTDSSKVVIPSPTLSPTLTPEADLEVSSPEADLLQVEADVQAL